MATQPLPPLSIHEASIPQLLSALSTSQTTAVDLSIACLHRIAHYDIHDGINAFTVLNPSILLEAAASDAWRASGKPPRPLEGIPYTLKDSYKYLGMTVTNGSPALAGLMSNEDAHIAKLLRSAGAVMVGKTNMPPMACGGMQRGLYGRAENPYNREYLAAAFSSGSSNGAAVSTAASMAVFALGSETVSSGRSPASNCGVVVYTPSKGVLGCGGLWPLYVTCDVPTPMARSVGDLLAVLDVIVDAREEWGDEKADFWRTQTHVPLSLPKPKLSYQSLQGLNSLRGKRIAVPEMYITPTPHLPPDSKQPYVSPQLLPLWHTARTDLERLGATVIPTTIFPLVTNYEDSSISGHANNILGAPEGWSTVSERGMVVAKSWDDFLRGCADQTLRSLADVDTGMLFPKPEVYVPDTFLEVKNLIDYPALPALAEKYRDTKITDLPGMKQAIHALQEQRRRDWDGWLDENNYDLVVFPAQGDAGKSDLETNLESAAHALRNGVRYSHGNRAVRHLGVPTVSVPMGVMEGEGGMPVNLTFAGRAGDDAAVLAGAAGYEGGSGRRVAPGLGRLETDFVGERRERKTEGMEVVMVRGEVEVKKNEGERGGKAGTGVRVFGTVEVQGNQSGQGVGDGEVQVEVEVFLDGKQTDQVALHGDSWDVVVENYVSRQAERLDWSLKPMPDRPVMVLVVARTADGRCGAQLLWAEVN